MKRPTIKKRTSPLTAPRAAAVASPRIAQADEPEHRAEQASGRWTFLTNHSHVLILLAHNPSMVLREVAVIVGITERAVQRIIADLEGEGCIERERVGRQNHYRINRERHLRHPVEAHRTVGDLLSLIDKST
jgi:hypothetical protein